MSKTGFILIGLFLTQSSYAASAGASAGSSSTFKASFDCCYKNLDGSQIVHHVHPACHAKYVQDRLSGKYDSDPLFKKRVGFCFFCYTRRVHESGLTSVGCEICTK